MGLSHKEVGRRKITLDELEKWAEVLGYQIEISIKEKV